MDSFRDVSGYATKVLSISKLSMNAFLKTMREGSPEFQKTARILKPAMSGIKAFSIFDLPLKAQDAEREVKELSQSVQEGDTQGTALSSLSMLLLVGDTLDSIETASSGLSKLTPLPPISWLSAISLPLLYTISGLGILSKSISVYANARLLSKLPSSEEGIRAFAAEHTRSKLAEKHFKWTTNKTALRQVKNLQERLEHTTPLSEAEWKQATDVIENIHTFSLRKLVAKVAGIAANILTIVGLSLILPLGATPIPYIILALALTAKLGIYFYEKRLLSRDLKEVSFIHETPSAPPASEGSPLRLRKTTWDPSDRSALPLKPPKLAGQF